MAYSAFAVAEAFIDQSDAGRIQGLTPMKLQKLMYCAQGWHLKLFKEPLLDDYFVRWQHGPVIPGVYHKFKALGTNIIYRGVRTLDASGIPSVMREIPEWDSNAWEIIEAVTDLYGNVPAEVLAAQTMDEGTAWRTGGGATGYAITHDEMLADVMFALP